MSEITKVGRSDARLRMGDEELLRGLWKEFKEKVSEGLRGVNQGSYE